jgi:hypothetical protein
MKIAEFHVIVIDAGLVVYLFLQAIDSIEIQLSLFCIIEPPCLTLLLLLHKVLISIALLHYISLLDVADELIVGLLHNKLVLLEDLSEELLKHI